jgi:hypothetical protein
LLIHVVLDLFINMVFNLVMMIKHTDLHPDSKIIDDLGGPAKLAEMLGYDKSGGVQRIQNWKTRGIPSSVKVARPDLFMADLVERAKALDDAQPNAGGTSGKEKMAHAA